MAVVEILREYKGKDGAVLKEPFLPPISANPPEKYSESPPPNFIVRSHEGFVHTTVRRNGSPTTFDVFQSDGSVNMHSHNVEIVNHAPKYYVGTITPDEPLVLQHIRHEGVPAKIIAEVRLVENTNQ